MTNEIIYTTSSFWAVLSFSFLVALTGAMSPGPLLTYTIIKSVKTEHRGYLMGLWIIAGHALLEMVIIILMLLGFSFLLKNTLIVRIIGITGGLILIYFGISIIRDVYKGKIQTSFLDPSNDMDKPDDAQRWLTYFGDPYRWSMQDADGQLGRALGIKVLPATLLIGEDNEVLVRHEGPITMEEFRARFLPAIRDYKGDIP